MNDDWKRKWVGDIQLKPFQYDGVMHIKKHDGKALVADEMGLGKTIQAIAYMKIRKIYPAIIVCPASLKWMWEQKVFEMTGIRADVIEGQKVRTSPAPHSKVIIINYDILGFWVQHIIRNIKPVLLILDENQYIKERTTQRYKNVKALSRHTPYILALSGTPLTNRPKELYATLNLIWPSKYRSYWAFAFRYCNPVKKRGKWDFDGANNLGELHAKLKRHGMLRRLKKDHLKEVADPEVEMIPLDLSKAGAVEYKAASRNFIRWLKSTSPAKAAKAKKAEKLVQMAYLKRLAAEHKMAAVFEWVDNFFVNTDGKLVLMCTHRNILKMIVNRYKAQTVYIDGSVTGKKRQYAVDIFQRNKKIRLFVGNIRAAGEGITLTAASTLAFIELDWTPGKHSQAEARIHRIGQLNTAKIYYLVAKGTIEEKLCKIIQEKQGIISQILDGSEKINNSKIFDLLEEELRRQKC